MEKIEKVAQPVVTVTTCLGSVVDLAAYAKERMRNDRLEHVLFGLLEEAGEVAGKFKRWERGDYADTPNDRTRFEEDVLNELGDVLFYLAELAGRMGSSVDSVAERVLAKLKDRHARGVTKGTGDKR